MKEDWIRLNKLAKISYNQRQQSIPSATHFTPCSLSLTLKVGGIYFFKIYVFVINRLTRHFDECRFDPLKLL